MHCAKDQVGVRLAGAGACRQRLQLVIGADAGSEARI
jgi:hypothetical protein